MITFSKPNLTIPANLPAFIQTRKKQLLACSLCFFPMLIIVYKNYFYYARGWHEATIQYTAVFWAVRLLLAPFLVVFVKKLQVELNEWPKFLAVQIMGLGAYLLLHCGISVAVLSSIHLRDQRLWNLFNTVKNDSFLLNLFIYTATVLMYYVWDYYDRSTDANKQADALEKLLVQSQNDAEILRGKIQAAFKQPANETLAVKAGQKTTLLKYEEIICFAAEGAYVKVITAGNSYLITMLMRDIEKTAPFYFKRVHRSCIVNTNFISAVKSLLNGDYTLALTNGMQTRLSRTYRQNLKAVTGKL